MSIIPFTFKVPKKINNQEYSVIWEKNTQFLAASMRIIQPNKVEKDLVLDNLTLQKKIESGLEQLV